MKERYKSEAKRNLEDYATSRCKTILIACLEEFEAGFGFIWGHGLPAGQITDQQKEYRKIWRDIREEALDRGHFRINQLKERFEKYHVENRKFKYVFKLPKE